ncbi:uncharacterized protein LAJ45_08704 [Morchella importuna]|uniref:Cyanovirin-N domain-containing protein n=1 Tax=Morchella conica CCBAS932 TaxID=1392247 RepID=A0A3N4KYP6_9PEZI|nr:uncharacterized protein LAJ45_08704 [Morchella importuna]KAH8147226.1 hypothetical protein LAJ45_08704 [Morchella importuna]RPB15666.1 hypothetical protein P167DRAFT_598702 [Morchella conica CCBAS932]
MKPTQYLTALLSSLLLLLLLTLTTPTTARFITSPRSTHAQPPNVLKLHPRGTDANPTPSTFICTTTKSSPFTNHVLFGAAELQQDQGTHWCTQDSRRGEEEGCIELINYGSALVMMCGEYRTKLRCYHLVDALGGLVGACTKDAETAAGRVSGRAVFGWGYLEVRNRQ